MRFARHISVMVMLALMMVESVLPVAAINETPEEDSVRGLVRETAEGVVDEVLFDNLSRLAGPSCSLYGLGIDLVNFFYDGQWSFVDPLTEILVLFKNQSWRELTWAMNDQREGYLSQLTSLEKRRCVIGFGLPEARATGDEEELQRREELHQVERQVAELRAKISYFGLQQKNILFFKPVFSDGTSFDAESFTLPSLETDKIFYFLKSDAISMNWDQFLKDSKQWAQTNFEELNGVLNALPDSCSAVVHLAHELKTYFIHAFEVDNGEYVSAEGERYSSFQEFVQKNATEISNQFQQKYCSSGTPARRVSTSAEEQYEKLLESLGQQIDTVGSFLSQVQAAISQLEQKRQQGSLSADETKQLEEFYRMSGELQGMLEYYALIIQKAGSPASQSLTRLAQKISDFALAILGLSRDEDGQFQSRLALSERLEQSRERQLQKICGRIQEMYRQSGRSTSDLPVIGTVDGRVYCRAEPQCEGVDLANLGTSEGRRKLAECSGFLFNSSELGPSQQDLDEAEIIGDDIGFILEQRSYNDLIKLRDLHFVSQRNTYKSVYGVETDSSLQVGQILHDVSKGLYTKLLYSENNPDSKTHYTLMRHIYKQFWKFMDEQKGMCLAPEDPE